VTRLGAVLAAAAVAALFAASTASATTTSDAARIRSGITHAVAQGWVKPDDAYRYRSAVTRALRDVRTLPKLRGRVIASQLSQLTPMSDSYTSPRALALFSQLEQNLEYLETHIIPPGRVDVKDDDGVLYRWFPNQGLEFHPLAAFGALNNVANTQDPESTKVLADALVARGIPRGNRLTWEYSFRFGFGRPPWSSGMAQAVAAQALARSGALLQDSAIVGAAARAYASVPPLTQLLPNGPWIKLYGFNREVVLNAQLQAILSLREYADATGDAAATALADRMNATAQALLPQFDTGDWSLYELGGFYAAKDYQLFVTQLLQKLAKQTADPFWIDAYGRFRSYYYDPPAVTQPVPAAPIYPQPLDGFLDTAQIQIVLSQRASVTLAIGGKITTYRLQRGAQTLTWTPPEGMAPGTYPVSVAAKNYAGRSKTFKLAPLEIRAVTAPSPIDAHVEGSTLVWAANDPGTPWIALRVDLTDPTGLNPPTAIDLGQQPLSGSAALTVPPGTWNATLAATNSAALTSTVPLGTLTGAG
jgi:hypothetical protein